MIGEAGFVTVDDERRGMINASVESVNVTITRTPVSDTFVEFVVRARNKLLLSKVDTVQRVYNRIIQRL